MFPVHQFGLLRSVCSSSLPLHRDQHPVVGFKQHILKSLLLETDVKILFESILGFMSVFDTIHVFCPRDTDEAALEFVLPLVQERELGNILFG